LTGRGVCAPEPTVPKRGSQVLADACRRRLLAAKVRQLHTERGLRRGLKRAAAWRSDAILASRFCAAAHATLRSREKLTGHVTSAG